jgi:BMFP domain-containing protein YqiC
MKTPDAFIERLVEQVNDLIEQSKQGGQDIQSNVRALIQSQLTKLDVVSREDFEVQQAMLEKNRTQIEQLESQLADLEKRLTE